MPLPLVQAVSTPMASRATANLNVVLWPMDTALLGERPSRTRGMPGDARDWGHAECPPRPAAGQRRCVSHP
jgi:hypothetical protein